MRDYGHDARHINQYSSVILTPELKSLPPNLVGSRGGDRLLLLVISIALLTEILFPLWCLSFP